MKKIILILCVIAMATAAWADSVTLKSGQTFTGELVSDSAKQVVLKTPGGIMTFSKDSVASTKSNVAARTEFQKRYSELATKLVTEHLDLAKWCMGQEMVQEARHHYQRALELDPVNEQAKQGLKQVAAKGPIYPVVNLELQLTDKSVVKGKTDKPFLTISTEYGELQIPLANIVSASFSPKHGEDKLVTVDFPVTGDILDTKMKVSTGMGELTLELDNVAQLSIKHKLSPMFVAETLDADLANVRETGLDIVFVYDASDSMEMSLVAFKKDFSKMGRCIQEHVPHVRMGCVAYRNSRQVAGQEFTYETKVISPLTSELDKVYQAFLHEGVGGGGDVPKSVMEGLQAAIEKAGWNPDSRKIIVLLGDAPPHNENDGLNRTYKMVEDWSNSASGFVHAIDTTGYGKLMPEFKEIAKRGSGVSVSLPKDEVLAQNVTICILGSRWADQITKIYLATPEADLVPPLPPPPPEN